MTDNKCCAYCGPGAKQSFWVRVHGPRLRGGPFDSNCNSWAIENASDVEVCGELLIVKVPARFVGGTPSRPSSEVPAKTVTYAKGEWTHFEIMTEQIPVIVEIVDVFEDAFKIEAKDLDPNLHGLFGGHGQRYTLSEVVILKGRNWIKVVHSTGGWVDYFAPTDIITVWPITKTEEI